VDAFFENQADECLMPLKEKTVLFAQNGFYKSE
jgi:hypothetical protein